MVARISVLLPAFNGAQYIAGAIQSVLAQSYADFELIVCDDVSTDGTAAIVDEYAKLDPRIQFFRNERRLGLFANYNECLRRAEGEFIKPFAQDDLLHVDALTKLTAVLLEYPDVALTSCLRSLINSSDQPLQNVDVPSPHQVFPAKQVVPGTAVIQECLFPVVNYIGEPCTVLFRKDFAGQGFDSNFHHLGDIEYWLRILLEGDYLFLPDECCLFRCHAESTSVSNSKNLATGPDLVRLGRKFAWVIEGSGSSFDDFLYESLDAYGDYLQFLMDSGALDPEDLRPFSNADPRDRLTQEFRELSFHALRLLGARRLSNADPEKSVIIHQNQKTIRSLESDLRRLLQSRSWQVTRVLRELRRLTDGEKLLEDNIPIFDGSDDPIAQQEAYMSYLRGLLSRITESRSWRLMKPFREIRQIINPSPKQPIS
jgi:glycosyltransferase involved in cell wall biosynthesis